MSKDIQAVSSWLAEWRNDLLRGSGKDPLVNLSPNLAKLLELPVDDAFPMSIDLDSQIKKIIRDCSSSTFGTEKRRRQCAMCCA